MEEVAHNLDQIIIVLRNLLMNVSIEDFTLMTVIGKGTYAKVILVKHKKTDEIYAMKILKKKHIAEKKQEEHIKTEKAILANMDHPFLTKLFYSFQDAKKLYFVLEYCPGGELFGLLQSKGTISEEQAKFYASQILLALESLHSKNVIYRDLKPENILIDKKGYIKLTDFGLSKMLANNDQSAMSVCGTPEYLAPEIIQKAGHGIMVDYWCFGCLVMEMVTGHPPFESENRYKLFEDIRSQQAKIPKNISPKLQSLLAGLLIKNPKKRLGFKGAEQVKKHPWFDGTLWDSVLKKTVKAPFIPVLAHESDTSNFDVEFTATEVESYQSAQSMKDGPVYVGFSYENKQIA